MWFWGARLSENFGAHQVRARDGGRTMKLPHLNGWVRIGIVISAVVMIARPMVLIGEQNNSRREWATMMYEICQAHNKEAADTGRANAASTNRSIFDQFDKDQFENKPNPQWNVH